MKRGFGVGSLVTAVVEAIILLVVTACGPWRIPIHLIGIVRAYDAAAIEGDRR